MFNMFIYGFFLKFSQLLSPHESQTRSFGYLKTAFRQNLSQIQEQTFKIQKY